MRDYEFHCLWPVVICERCLPLSCHIVVAGSSRYKCVFNPRLLASSLDPLSELQRKALCHALFFGRHACFMDMPSHLDLGPVFKHVSLVSLAVILLSILSVMGVLCTHKYLLRIPSLMGRKAGPGPLEQLSPQSLTDSGRSTEDRGGKHGRSLLEKVPFTLVQPVRL